MDAHHRPTATMVVGGMTETTPSNRIGGGADIISRAQTTEFPSGQGQFQTRKLVKLPPTFPAHELWCPRKQPVPAISFAERCFFLDFL
jgi:hypothetical protein